MSCERICNICGDDLDSIEKVQVLKCGHEFCNECIFDWFQNILNNMKKSYYSSQYLKARECPMCRHTGGYLKLFEGDEYVCGIHGNKKNFVPRIKPPDPVIVYCEAKLKTKNKLCKNKGKECHGYYCGVHKKFATQYPKKIETVDNKLVVTPHTDMTIAVNVIVNESEENVDNKVNITENIVIDEATKNVFMKKTKKKKKGQTLVNKYFS